MPRVARSLDSPRIVRVMLLWAACAVIAILGAGSTSAQQPPNAPFVPGEILVRFRPVATESQRDGFRQAVGSRLLRRFDRFDIEHIQLPANVSVAQALRLLQGNPDVLSAAPNYLQYVAAPGPPNDPSWLASSPPNLWGLEKIDAQAAWNDFGTDSSNVVVAMIDTGTDYNHPDLAANIWSSPGPFTFQGVTCPQGTHGVNTFANPMTCDPTDDSGHGTFTAGIVGAVGNNGIGVVGVNWNVQIMPCKANGPDAVGTSASAIACLNFILDQKVNHGVNVRVINNSWGNFQFDPNIKAAIDATVQAGIINVCAAGNVGGDNDGSNPFYPASYTSPGIVSVAASDRDDNPAVFEEIDPATGQRYRTNYGATSVDLAAPGALTVSTFSRPQSPGVEYLVNGGTSYAAPHVSGVAVRLAALHPALSVSELKTILMGSVDHLAQWSGKVVSGGRLNMYEALRSAGGGAPGTGATAAFVGTDTTTQGSWVGVYGSGGYMLANDATAMPSYAQVALAGQANFTWVASTTDPRAVQRPAGTDRIAATWYTGTSFTIDVNITDGALHQVALYNLDWNGANTRVQRVDVLDANTHAVLDTRTISAFTDGQYLVWTLGGHVTLRVTNTGPTTVTVSGLFFDAGASSSPTITTSPANQVVTPGQTATMSVVATGTAPLAYQWYAGTSGTTTTPIAGATASTYTTPALTTTTSYWVRVSNASGTANSATATITVATGTSATAAFVGTDTTTQGSWVGVYGSGGYMLANDATAMPSYAQVALAGQANFTWVASTTDPRAVQRPAGTDRIAATWYTGTSFTIDVNITDGALHQVALYNLDWNGANTRVQRVDVLDANTHAVLDTRTISAFTDGQYLVWTLGGHVTLRVTNTGPTTVTVSGLFFDAGASSSPTITTSPANQVVTPGQTATMSVVATGTAPLAYQWYAGTSGTTTTPIAGATASTYTTPALTTTTSYWVRVSNASGTANSATATITVATGTSATAAFVGTDTTTQGSWVGVYGSGGYMLANDATAMPSYAQVALAGQANFTWVASTTDPRAVQRPAGTDRIAATWYTGTSFTIDVNITDGALHQVALYNLDWNGANTRVQRVDVLDANTHAVLDTRTISAFTDGQYLVWTLGGHVTLRVTNTGPTTVTVSGLFFDGGALSLPITTSPANQVIRPGPP